MCIAIVKLKDTTISKEVLQTCFTNNPDNCGMAYIDNGKIIINKYDNFEKFYTDYAKIEHKSNMLIHFRIATHGGVNIENTHPFVLNSRMALIHNGVLSGYGDKEKISDTRDFINKVIGNISWKMWKNPSFIELVGNAIGGSKLGILDVTGDFYIVNEQKGTWKDGAWYSNNSYEPKKPVVKTTYSHDSYWDYYYNDRYGFNNNRTVKDNDINQKKLFVNKKKDIQDLKTTYVGNISGYEYSNTKIFKCNKCGKEYLVDDCDCDINCPNCISPNVTEIGYTYADVKYILPKNLQVEYVD